MPGVTAGVAAPAYAGIPVTHRDDASAVAFVTGHEDPTKPETALDWEALARFPGTLVLYMGVKNLPLIAERLAAAGRDPAEPAAAIERGTLDGQRTVTATLAELPAAVAEAGLGAPAILLFGSVAARRDSIAWIERRPLWGRTVVVTRARAQVSGLAATLRDLGAEVVELPAIRIVPRLDTDAVRDAVADLHSYAVVVLTSPNGVHLLFEAMAAHGRDARALANANVAAIGPGTARALAAHGVIADLVPESYVAEALVETLTSVEVAGRPVLVARAAQARDVIPEALAERGAEVDVVALYETVREPPDPEAVEAAQGADYVTFTSSSTVRYLVEAVGDRFPRSARVVSIGPVTTEAARELGIEVAVEAERHDIEGLVEALVSDAAATLGSASVSSGAGSLKGGGVLGLALLAAARRRARRRPQPSSERAAPAVTCAMHSGSHRLVIHAHELRERFHIPRAVAQAPVTPRPAATPSPRAPDPSHAGRDRDRATHRRGHRARQDVEPVRDRPVRRWSRPARCATAARRPRSTRSTRSRSSSASTRGARTCTSTSATGCSRPAPPTRATAARRSSSRAGSATATRRCR